MSRYDDEHFLLWFTRATPTWLELSAQARGVAISVAMELNPKTGKLTLRKGLPSLAVLLRLPWEVIEPALAELLAAGKLQWDGSNFVLSDPEHQDRRRKTSTERVAEHRARKKGETGPPPAPTSCNEGNVSPVSSVSGNAGNVPSSLVLSSLVSDQIPEEIPSARETPDPGEEPPDWWPDALETVAMRAEPIAEPGAAWLRYAGHRAGKHLPADRRDAIYWLTTVVIREQQKARDEGRHRAERDAKFDIDRKARFADAPGKVEHDRVRQQSPEDAKRFADELAARIATRKRGAA